jgi:D-3-phosphoglycerate dehydrogenase
MSGKIIVFATSFLDAPVAKVKHEGEAKKMLEDAAKRHGLKLEFRCSRNPLEPMTASELVDAVAVIADLEKYGADLLKAVGPESGGSLGLVARYGIGVSSVDLQGATDAKVQVTNTPGASAPPTAEWAVTSIMSIAGRRKMQHERASIGKTKFGPSRLDVSKKTLGIIGTGTIGRRVFELLSGYDMDVIAYDPYPNGEWAKAHGVSYVGLDELCAKADFITIHASGESMIIGERELSLMSPTTALINCARGHLVDNKAVYEAVKNGKLWGYGLDEVWQYPDLPLEGLNIEVSPHVGSDSDNGKIAMQMLSAQSVVEFLDGKELSFLVNPQK